MISRRVETLFTALLECSHDDRQARLAELNADDPELVAELKSLLTAADQTQGFLSVSPMPAWAEPFAQQQTQELIDQCIGCYRLRRELGRGGMGVVYLAERADGQYQQRVAVKLIRSGCDVATRIERFRAERQILARLIHPYIARLLDGGSRENGEPYLVMEYVEGEPIDAYCSRHRLDLNRRLTLFSQVCQAVDYAHQNGVIHRDLKPGNILIGSDGTPKLLDFGVAKLLAAPTDPHIEHTALTVDGHLPMTPDFAAPEQLGGQPVTPASDVYALGLILYELLTERRPFENSFARCLADHVPAKPSAVVAQHLRPAFRGDIDNIVQRALRYSPCQRYASAGRLGEAIDRVQAHQPASSERPSGGFVARPAVKASLAAIAIAGSIVVGLKVSPHPFQQAKETGALAARPIETSPQAASLAIPQSQSPVADRCAALQRDYLSSGNEQLFQRQMRCWLEDAEWNNGRGNYASALLTLESMQQLYRGYQGTIPAALQAHKGRVLVAFATALEGIGKTRKAQRFHRQWLAWRKQANRGDE